MKNQSKRKVRDGLLKSKGVVETVAGGLLSLVDPTGISGDAVKKGIDLAITKVADEFDTRKLSELESDRVKDVMVLAIKKIENNLFEGKQLRDDNFFSDTLNNRSDGEEIFEAIIISAQRESQKMKLIFYANLLANIGFCKDISSDEAIQIISYAERLSYRQCLLLTAIFMNTAQYKTMGNANILADKFITNGTEKEVPFERVSLYQDVLDLYRMGLIFECRGNLILTIGQVNLHSLIVEGIGMKIVNLMELDRMIDGENTEKHIKDFVKLFMEIKDDRYKLVDENHFVRK
ncbi:MAG: hypothetical protein PUE01_00340 [Clostridiaceae bacterium]|nr:hypothetical protein [Clostridiaceae bacterium]